MKSKEFFRNRILRILEKENFLPLSLASLRAIQKIEEREDEYVSDDNGIGNGYLLSRQAFPPLILQRSNAQLSCLPHSV